MAERSNDRVTESSNDFYEDIVTERKEWVNPPKELRFNYQLLFGKEGRSADQYFAIFPNGIIVTGVALFHPLIQIGLQFLEGNPDGQINIHLEDERFWNVADRGQKSKIPKFKDHALCTVEIQNQSFEINHAIDTSLVNFNSRLKAEPNLILQKYPNYMPERKKGSLGMVGKVISQYCLPKIASSKE